MTHDPMCPASGLGDHWADLCGDCKLIARVRKDERNRTLPEWAYQAAYNNALTDAIREIRKHVISGYFCSCGIEINTQTGHHATVIEALQNGEANPCETAP